MVTLIYVCYFSLNLNIVSRTRSHLHNKHPRLAMTIYVYITPTILYQIPKLSQPSLQILHAPNEDDHRGRLLLPSLCSKPSPSSFIVCFVVKLQVRSLPVLQADSLESGIYASGTSSSASEICISCTSTSSIGDRHFFLKHFPPLRKFPLIDHGGIWLDVGYIINGVV